MSENKYQRTITGRNGSETKVDVYDVLEAFGVTCPALQHLIKKALCAGRRGHKTVIADLQDIKSSADRAIQLQMLRDYKNDFAQDCGVATCQPSKP